MKKLMILVSCVALLLVLSKANFAQEVDVEDFPPACSCCYCAAAPAPLPFAYPPCPAPKHFGSRLAAIAAKRTLPFGTPYPGMPVSPVSPIAAPYPVAPMGPVAAPYPYPFGVADLKLRAVRRAARLAPRPQPYPVPVPVAVAAPPALPVPEAPAPVVQTGRRNIQRNGDAPVINFMSIVRTQQPFPGYYPYPVPMQPQQ